MNRKRAISIVSFMSRVSALAVALAYVPSAHAEDATRAANACLDTERWTFSRAIDSKSRSEFERLASGGSSTRAYAHASLLEKKGASAEARIFGTFWKGRALLRANLVHLAHEQFNQVAASFPSAATLGVQTAAIECLNRLALEYPALQPSGAAFARLPQYFSLAPSNQQAYRDFALAHVQATLAQSPATARQSPQGTLSLLRGSGAHEQLATGMITAASGNHDEAIRQLEAFLKQKSLTPALTKQVNAARLLLARSYYTAKNYDAAATAYKRIDKSSNEFAGALSELAWAHLMDEDYPKAIGIATNSQVGALRDTFTPESPMILAMSLNELCQYQDSLRAIRKFQADYRPSYEWLKKWSNRGGNRSQPLYPLAISFLSKKTDTGTVPARVASEWIKSSTFIALQDQIRLSFKEERALKELVAEAADDKEDFVDDEQTALAAEAAALQARLERGTQENARLRRDLVARINSHLGDRSQRMLTQLDEIAENTKLIQVEIFNGASHDIIWQNANPEYREVSRKWKAEDKREQAASRVWNWGTIRKSGDKVEVWEDELGAFKASLKDNCSNKQRYMALKTVEE